MVGILVHGDNHFIVRGRLPDRDVARALIRHWSIIQIGATTPPSLEKWRISRKKFREDLEWAVIVPRVSNAAYSQCSAPSFARRHAPEEIGSAQARRPHHGRIEHRSVGDRVEQDVECSYSQPSF